MISLARCFELMDSKLSLITIGDKKIPNTKWKEQQTEQLSKVDFKKHYELPTTQGVGICTGYKNLEVIDIDTKILPTEEEKSLFWNEFLETLRKNIVDFDNKISIYKTISGGYHLLYRCTKIEGNLKLARLEGYKEALIETRGIGGYVFVYTENVSKLTYTNIIDITEMDRNVIFSICKSYNFVEDKVEAMPNKTVSTFTQQGKKSWDDFNAQNNVWQMVSDQFTEVGTINHNTAILRNGSKSGHSGYIFKDTGKMFLYSTGTEYPHEKPLSPFDIYTYRYCNGDYKLAASNIYKEGYGDRIEVERIRIEDFWYYTEKGGIVLDPFKFKVFLESNHLQKYYPTEIEHGFSFLKKDGNFISITAESEIKDFVLKYLYNKNEIDVWNLMASRKQYFTTDFLSMINTSTIEISRDNKENAMLYYKNKAIKITKNNFELFDYDDLKGYVWKKQVIERSIKLKPESDGIFKRFIWLISGQDVDRYYTLKSVIGYLLHSYQNESKPKAIIFNDEMISDVPNGGSGKGLIHKAIAKIKNVHTEDGKKFDPRGQFAYQGVDKSTQVFLMDDVPKNFNFENLFSIVTEGMTIEKKGKDAYKLPLKDSPKLSITTNYTIKGEGSSHYRRIFEVEIANYFNENHTPDDEFGHQFFTDWDVVEWACFDNFMIRCIQFYLNNGLVESKKINLDYRKLIDSLGAEFIEFMESKDLTTLVIDRKTFRDDFNDKNFHLAKFNTAQKFNKKVKDYCKYYGIEFTEDKYNGSQHFYFTDNRNKAKLNIQDEAPF